MSLNSGSQSVTVLDIDAEMKQTDIQQPRQISRRNKTIAAISSAAATSLLMTPFDVIKTRMQTQAPPEPLFQPSIGSGSGTSCCQTKQIVSQEGVACRYDPRVEGTKAGSSRIPSSRTSAPFSSAGSGSSRPRVVQQSARTSANHMSGAACIYPDKNVAARELKQIQNHNRLSGLWDGVIKVGRSEGIRGLWRGLTPTLVMTVPSQLTYMTCYDLFRTNILALRPPATTSSSPSLSNVSGYHMMASLTSGALARSISATLVTPLELIRTRLQASSTSHKLSTTFANLRVEVMNKGPRVLFRGLVPTLYRDVPFSAIYFTGYESMKLVLSGAGFGERRDDSLRRQDFAVAFLSGATSGFVAAIFTQPFDVIKTRLQAFEHQTTGRSNANVPKTTMQVWRQIMQTEGAKGLMRGVSPRVAKVAPACGVMISCFELVARGLDEYC
ncbi:mitochondrial carrier [Meira miltonrushii]|uniref:Mitochondrial carrier n=1 Tax=Meira miltonrushii TaxID=1280837 RepID=A0A316VMK1_9BASI|nr:mitochondrial carrier [Meira miltonrushii]PWN37633.1 mitochondrial carrier [Meira miltonrushii]